MSSSEGLTCPKLCIVCPCLNEAEVIQETAFRLSAVLDRLQGRGLISSESMLLFVDDGSEDDTWKLIQELSGRMGHIFGVRLGVNAGHQVALRAGFEWTLERSDLFVSIDADLQDDPDAIEAMVREIGEGAEVVLGVRSNRSSDSFFKRWSASLFYRVSELFGVPTVRHHADFRMMTRATVRRILASGEREIYWRAAALTVTRQVATVEYARQVRQGGETKYSARKMWRLAFGALTSWSSTPLRVITAAGFYVSALSLISLLYVLIGFTSGNAVPGWVSLAASIYFLFGITLFALGTLGEYLKQVLEQVKGRPPFHIVDQVGPGGETND